MDWAAFADAWRGGYGPSMSVSATGRCLPWTKLDVLHRRDARRAARASVQDRRVADAEKVTSIVSGTGFEAWPDSVAGLTRLKRIRHLAAVERQPCSLLTNMAKFAGPAVGRDPSRRSCAALQA